MRILLLGANGRTGRRIVSQALKSAITVTALVRSEDRLADVGHPQLSVRIGSACDPSTLAALLPGHDLVISVLGPRWPTRRAAAIYPDSAMAIVAAMHASDVKRLLVTSSALLFPTRRLSVRLLRWLVPRLVSSAQRMETEIQASQLDWTLVRTGFLNNKATLAFRHAEGALPPHDKPLPRTALARFLLEAARKGIHVRQVVGLSS